MSWMPPARHPCAGHPCDGCAICQSGRCCLDPSGDPHAQQVAMLSERLMAATDVGAQPVAIKDKIKIISAIEPPRPTLRELLAAAAPAFVQTKRGDRGHSLGIDRHRH